MVLERQGVYDQIPAMGTIVWLSLHKRSTQEVNPPVVISLWPGGNWLYASNDFRS